MMKKGKKECKAKTTKGQRQRKKGRKPERKGKGRIKG